MITKMRMIMRMMMIMIMSCSNDEDSSCGEEDAVENEALGQEEEGDKKELCIEIKLGKEEKPKPSLDRLVKYLLLL